jgi:two-component system LytT family response regulator
MLKKIVFHRHISYTCKIISIPYLLVSDLILKCVIVDDSRLQRLSIVKLVKDHPSLKLVAEYNNAIEAKRGLANSHVDIIFLDIEMPVLSGFDLIDGLTQKPQIIFITGKTQYAFKAFDYNAVDYLQKPVTKERFNNSVEKALVNYKMKNEIFPDADEEDFIFIKTDLQKRKVFLDDLLFIEALGDYAKLVTKRDTFVVLSTMKSFEETLPKDRFFRLHKSYLINLDKIDRYNSKFVEIGKEQIPVSRIKKADFYEALTQINKKE